MAVDDEHDPPVPPPDDDGPAQPKRRRKRAPAGAPPKRTSRFERRAEAAKRTLQELIRLRKPDLDIGDLSFIEVVDRDADAWGKFLAQLAEWVVPFGQLIDLVFGAPLMVIVGLAPSVRAARRDLATRRARKQFEQEQARMEEELQVPQEWTPPE